jgi:hypothetical protein
MGVKFYPDEYLKKVMPKKLLRNGLLYDDLTIKKTYLKALSRAAAISEKQLNESVYGVIKQYRAKEKLLKAGGVEDYAAEAVNDEVLLTRRVENLLVWSEVQEQKEEHAGEQYRWLPSSAKEADPYHQTLYGKIFEAGTGDKDGNMPGERYGCQCGIEWLGNPAKEKILERTDKGFVRKSERLYQSVQANKDLDKEVPYGKVSLPEANRIKWATGLDMTGYEHTLTGHDLKHIYKRHGSYIKELKLGQLPVRASDIALIPEITRHFDSVVLSPKRAGNGQRILIYRKKIGNEYYYLEGINSEEERKLNPKTMYIKKK